MSDSASTDVAAGSQSTLLRDVIDEFGRHLDFLAEQLAAAVSEADRDCISVGQSFDELSSAKCAIEAIPCAEPLGDVLRQSCRQIDESIQDAVVALQYHDRLAQRLSTVRAGLVRLQSLLQGPSPRSYETWLHDLREVEQINRAENKRLGLVTEETAVNDTRLPDSSVELF